MKLISNVVLLATIVNINLYASSKDWENIDTLEKLGEIEESIKLKNQLIDTIKKDYGYKPTNGFFSLCDLKIA